MESKTVNLVPHETPDFIDIRIKRNVDVYTLKVLKGNGLVIKSQFKDIDELAVVLLDQFNVTIEE